MRIEKDVAKKATKIHSRYSSVSNLVWTQDLVIGLQWQDLQHQELFLQINFVLNAFQAGKDSTELVPLIGSLDYDAMNHFRQEESEMEAHSFYEMKEHFKEHEQFLSKLREIQSYLNEKIDQRHAHTLLELLAGWFRNHVYETDRKLGVFLVSRQKKGKKGII